MCTVPQIPKKRTLKRTCILGSIYWVLFWNGFRTFTLSCFFGDTKRRHKLRRKGPCWEPILRFDHPKLPKAPCRPQNWAHTESIQSFGQLFLFVAVHLRYDTSLCGISSCHSVQRSVGRIVFSKAFHLFLQCPRRFENHFCPTDLLLVHQSLRFDVSHRGPLSPSPAHSLTTSRKYLQQLLSWNRFCAQTSHIHCDLTYRTCFDVQSRLVFVSLQRQQARATYSLCNSSCFEAHISNTFLLRARPRSFWHPHDMCLAGVSSYHFQKWWKHVNVRG